MARWGCDPWIGMAGGGAGMGLGCVLMAREYVDSGMGVRRAENQFRISEFRMGLWKAGAAMGEVARRMGETPAR